MYKQFTVRRLRVGDLERVVEIEDASFGTDAYERNTFADYLRRCGGLFLAAERERKVWGYLIACTQGNRAELVSMAIHPAARRRGAASALMESVLRRLRRRRVVRLGLMVKVTNLEAQAFYAKYGFTKVRLAPGYYEDGADGWLMAKEI
jgi:ribosomal-protein-alanine N-acetyltransferase